MTRRIATIIGIAAAAVTLTACSFTAGGYQVDIKPVPTNPDGGAATCVTNPDTGRVECHWNTSAAAER